MSKLVYGMGISYNTRAYQLIIWISDECTGLIDNIIVTKDLVNSLGLRLTDEEVTPDSIDSVSMMLYIKNRYSVSGSAYHEMASLCSQMPHHYHLKKRAQ